LPISGSIAIKACQHRVLTKRAVYRSLRSIAEEMEHGVQTVRTVIETKDGLERTTIGRVQSKASHR
jgi:hypothetical protein